jgi:hypothetical protein
MIAPLASTPPYSPASGDDSPPTRCPWAAWLGLAAFYTLLVVLAALARRDHINPDGVACIRNALCLADGRVSDSVSGHWSPLLCWSIAPWLACGVDGLYAARIVLAIWGALLLAGAAVFVRRCTWLAWPWNFVVLLLIALATVRWATSDITSDILQGAVLVWYFALSATAQLVQRRRVAWAAGMIGGVAYLAKYYALPFFLLHFTLSVLLHAAGRNTGGRRGRAVNAWLAGVAGFAIVAAPWIAVLSLKYDRFTFSISGSVNRFSIGPGDHAQRLRRMHRAQMPPPGRITVGETPELMTLDDWSPLESRDAMVHQLKHIHRNLQRIVHAIADFELLGLVPGVLLFAPILRRTTASRAKHPCPAVWPLMTVGVYAGGFLPLSFESRYIEPVLWPVCCAVLIDVVVDARRRVKPLDGRWLKTLTVIVVLSLAGQGLEVGRAFLPRLRQADASYREAGQSLHAAGCPGPVAACDDYWHEGLYVAYHASLPYLGVVSGRSAAEMEAALAEHHARVLVANSKWILLDAFLRQSKWRLVEQRMAGEDVMYLFCLKIDNVVSH